MRQRRTSKEIQRAFTFGRYSWLAGVALLGLLATGAAAGEVIRKPGGGPGGKGVSPASGAEGDFFRAAPDAAQRLPADKLYPRGRIFPFGLYAASGKRDKPNGFTLLGPYGREENVADARKFGMKCTYSISLPMDFHKKPLVLSAEEIRQRIKQQVEKAMDSPEIGWWYLAPEELRYWRKNELEYLEVAARTIHETDPEHRPVWMYDPGHRNAAGLAHTVRHLDVCGKGLYTNYSGQRDSRIWVRWSIEQEREAIRQANPKAIPLAVPEMFQQPPDEFLPMIPRWVRHDVYLSLVSGAKGMMIFSGWRRPKFPAFDEYYQAYAACAREINGPLALGQVFLFGQARDDIKLKVLGGPAEVSLRIGSGTGAGPALKYPSVSVLNAAYGAKRYLLLVNSANEPVRVQISGLPAEGVVAEDLFQAGGGGKAVGSGFSAELAALEVRGWCLGRAAQ